MASSDPPSAVGIRRSLGLSVLDAVMHAVMLGVSESYLGALAVELGHRDTALALLATVPLLAGAISQLAAGILIQWFGGRKRMVVTGAFVQGLSVLGFVGIAGTEQRALAPFLIAKTCWWIAGSVIAPPWGAWMAHLTEHTRRERYFAWRSAAAQAALLVAMVGSGIYLHSGGGRALLERYELLFWIGAAARCASAFALSGKVALETPGGVGPGMFARTRVALATSHWKVPLYMASLMFGAYVAVPFFTPYMLKNMGMDYQSFALLNSLSILSKALVFPLCHRLVGRVGLPRVLWIGGTGVGLIPLVWYLSDSVTTIALVQLFGGASWAALEYASFQILLQSSSSECRVEFLSLHGMLSGLGQLTGSLTGSALIEQAGLAHRDVFLVSGVMRIAPLLAMAPLVRRVGFRSFELFTGLVSTRPVGGAMRRLIVDDEPEEPRTGPDRPH